MIPQIAAGNFPFPSSAGNPKKRGDEFYLAWAKAAYDEQMIRGRRGNPIGYERREEMTRLRAYSMGRQDEDQYREKYLGSLTDLKGGNAEKLRKGFSNINWSIFSVAPKFMNVLKGKFDDLHLSLDAQTVDETSATEKSDKKWKMWSESVNQSWVSAIEQQTGQQLIAKDKWRAQTIEELEMFESIGGFKHKFEVSIEKVLKACFELSMWDDKMKDLLIEDIVNFNMLVTKSYYDTIEATIKTKYIDPVRFISSYSRIHGFSKSPYQGHVEFMTIGELRDQGKLNQKKVQSIVNSYQNNPLSSNEGDDWNNEGRRGLSGDKWWCDDFTVPVLELDFKVTDTKYVSESTNKDGKNIYRRTGKRSGSKPVNTQMLYATNWIIGTEVTYGNGPSSYTSRDRDKRVKFSYSAEAIVGKSITEMCLPVYDQIHMNWLKFQNALAKAPVAGMAIELGALSNVSLAGVSLRPDQLVQMRNVDGTLLYHASALRTTGNYVSGKPIQDLPGGMGAQLGEFIATNEMLLNHVRELTGITPSVAASGAGKSKGLGLAQMDADSTSNVLKPIFKIFTSVKQEAGRNMMLKFQLAIRQNKNLYKGFYPIVGKTSLEAIKISDGMESADMGIFIKATADASQRAEFKAAALESLRAGKNGMPGIRYSDYFFLQRLIDSGGSLSWAQTYLAYKENEEADRLNKEAKERMKIQNDGTLQVTQAKSQAKLQEINAQMEADINIYDRRRQADLAYERGLIEATPPETQKMA